MCVPISDALCHPSEQAWGAQEDGKMQPGQFIRDDQKDNMPYDLMLSNKNCGKRGGKRDVYGYGVCLPK